MRLPSRSVSVAKRPAGRRSGFTLVELLVVISIIAVLSSLILPGVMNARRAARRAQCLNNMKNCGIAFVDYYTTQNVFPASGRIDYTPTTANPTQVQTITQLLTELATPSLVNIQNYTSTSATDASRLRGMRYSWVREMLPRLDRSDLFDLWDTSATTSYGTYLNSGNAGNVGVAGKRPPGGDQGLCNTDLRVLVCPEDITIQQGRGNMSYVVNGGFTPHPEIYPVGASGTAGTAIDLSDPLQRQVSENLYRMGLMFVEGATRGRRHTPESVKDGLTTTVMVSENVNAGFAQNVAYNGGTGTVQEVNWGCPHPANTSFFVQTAGITDPAAQVLASAALTAPNTAANNYKYAVANTRGPTTGGINGDVTGLFEFNSPYPSSFHTGGVHIMMCDGGVRFMSDAIDGKIWSRLVTPDGGRVVGPASTGTGASLRLMQQFEDVSITSGGSGTDGNTQIPIKENEIP